MSGGHFSILEAVKKAYMFAGAQWRYLLRLCALPLVLHLATAAGIQSLRPDASIIETFLWSLPANVAFAWFMFAEARLLLLGERVDRLPPDAAYLADRRHAMRVSIIILLLFDMALTAIAACMDWAVHSGGFGTDAAVTVPILFLLGTLFWGLRFAVAPILASVGYPLRSFLRRVHGMEFSVRLLGLGFLCALPVYFVLEILLESFLPVTGEITPDQMTALIILSAPVAIIVPALLNAAAAFALKDMLKGPP